MDPPASKRQADSSSRTAQLAASSRIAFAWMSALAFTYPVFAEWDTTVSWRIAMGIAVGIIGMIWRSIAIIYRSQHSGLLTSGPYGVMRHPRYVGTMIGFGGLSLTISPYSIAIAPLILLLVSHWLSSLKEESDLKQEFGDRYMNYKHAVPAIFPRALPTLDDLDFGEALRNRKTVERLAMTWVTGAIFIVLFVLKAVQ